MKKTTKVLSLFLAAAFIFTMMSLSVFATDNSKNIYNYDAFPGYRLKAYARYDGNNSQVHAITQMAWYNNNAQEVTATLYSQILIRYTDGTSSQIQEASPETVLSERGDGVYAMPSLNFDNGKHIYIVYTTHTYFVDDDSHLEFVDLHAGIDF